MQNGLTAREERAFAEIVRELEPEDSSVRAWHLGALGAGWLLGWVALVSSIGSLVLAAGCFLLIAGLSAAMGWVVLEATSRTVSWDRDMPAREKFRACWRNLT